MGQEPNTERACESYKVGEDDMAGWIEEQSAEASGLFPKGFNRDFGVTVAQVKTGWLADQRGG